MVMENFNKRARMQSCEGHLPDICYLRINKKFTIFDYKPVFSVIEITSYVNFGTRRKIIDKIIPIVLVDNISLENYLIIS